MTARTGLSDLITKLRAITNAGTAEFTLAGVAYFSDDQLQDVLDANVIHLEGHALRWLPDSVGGGSIEYHRAAIGYKYLEGPDSGTLYWAVRDGTGELVGTANYTLNTIDGIIRFTDNCFGTTYYLTARSYDLYAAGAEVWTQRAAHFSDWYQFMDAGQQFLRHQVFQQAQKMADMLRQNTGKNRQVGNVHVATFVRTDLQ